MSTTPMLHFFRTPLLSPEGAQKLLQNTRKNISGEISGIQTEYCYNIQAEAELSDSEMEVLKWLLSETFEPENFGDSSFLKKEGAVIEVGPRMNFQTAWSTNAVAVCSKCGLGKIKRVERSRRYLLEGVSALSEENADLFLRDIHDRMTECRYPEPLETFETGIEPEPFYEIPVMEEGRKALEKINEEMGLAFDDWDLDYYTRLFKDIIKRNPTNVECFDIGQSNSEHSRHWFFKGRMIIDGEEMPDHLIKIIKSTLDENPSNSLIAFEDNSSAIKGARIQTVLPGKPGVPGPFTMNEKHYNIIFTAETHNFPSGVAPFPGAETGTGGRIRDVHATGKGSLVVAGTAAYCVGNLRIPGYELPWEDETFEYPGNLASPLEIEIEASNGASDYGNKFGEPLIQGYTRAFGMRLPDGQRREWIKPIMFTGGVGQIDQDHLKKGEPEEKMLVVKIGGPAYRIGMGGGAASSMMQGENAAELDFNAVQRGDAEMEQKVNRVIRACVEMGKSNPIVSIHDQGAGGNCNVVKEIISPAGAKIDIRAVEVGDNTLSVLEIWGAEYQEQDALLIRPASRKLFNSLCQRENVKATFIGEITGDGKIVLVDNVDGSTPVDLDLDKILGSMPQKEFKFNRVERLLEPLALPEGLKVKEALDRVFRLVSVGSKRFLTSKVDRSVTGLIARQQCCGPLQLTVSDVAVIAQSHYGNHGAAISIGEQPVKSIIDPSAMARMCVGEALTNIVWAPVSGLNGIKCSCNWMWAAKLPGEGVDLYDAAVAMRDIMVKLGIAVDGGKDSVSMAAQVNCSDGTSETVKAPGAMVLSAYASCPDITKTVTPDLKHPGESAILFIDLGKEQNRLGGSSLAQVYGQVGDESPDVDDVSLLKRSFNAVQKLIDQRLIAAGHDRSDGGLITTLLEMAFSGNCGLGVNIESTSDDPLAPMFSEELGLVMEVANTDLEKATAILEEDNVPCTVIGKSESADLISISCNGVPVIEERMSSLRDLWEETSFQLEQFQTEPACLKEEQEALAERSGPKFVVNFIPKPTSPEKMEAEDKPRVAIIREEGSNGDREMISAFYLAGFEPWDVAMSDLLSERVSLEEFRGVVFVGGFSYADVLDSAKGWAGCLRFNGKVWDQFNAFYERPDTFSLGVCNGCQLMALLGWIPYKGTDMKHQPRFIRNRSGRFESRFASVKIGTSPSIMLKGMEETVLGIWVAHGEGKAFFPDEDIYRKVLEQNLAPIRYVDDNNEPTELYPFNPNGSPEGIASLCSEDGRHIAMMPHPERAFLKWQWGWMPEHLINNLEASPWLRMFQNAREWCEES